MRMCVVLGVCRRVWACVGTVQGVEARSASKHACTHTATYEHTHTHLRERWVSLVNSAKHMHPFPVRRSHPLKSNLSRVRAKGSKAWSVSSVIRVRASESVWRLPRLCVGVRAYVRVCLLAFVCARE